MISTTREFVTKFLKSHSCGEKVLDVGSFDVNGRLSDMFPGAVYTGVDMRPGPNVEFVINGHNLLDKFKEEEFDTVICFDTLEHDIYFWLTVENMKKVLKKDGWLLIGVPSINHPIHDYPNDYYRFTEQTFREVFFANMKNVSIESQYYFGQNDDRPDQVFGYAQK